MPYLLSYEEAMELTGSFHDKYAGAHDYAMESIRDGVGAAPGLPEEQEPSGGLDR